MRITFDKSHKRARREAVRLKESARIASLRTDDPKPSRRQIRLARRMAGAACLALCFAATSVPAAGAWSSSTSGTVRGHIVRHHAPRAKGDTGGNDSAVAAFRSRFK